MAGGGRARERGSCGLRTGPALSFGCSGSGSSAAGGWGGGGGGALRQVGRVSDEFSALPPPPPGPALRLPLQRPDDLSREGAESRGPGRSPAPPLLRPLPGLTWPAAAAVTPFPPPPRPPQPRPTRDLPARGCSGNSWLFDQDSTNYSESQEIVL
ncbi:wiskott-Aldrich syndrome protein homolog [Phacochoerus africanus]|uniref:wiskott-Aldrich syndrome protein homolog n=1 Tax=Phacochoerus africanus TaxID=41426 RepID=UPI001FDA6480|nr:wiskott-Aldrich syndrome protein homolog [Phacochoerus africanus]